MTGKRVRTSNERYGRSETPMDGGLLLRNGIGSGKA